MTDIRLQSNSNQQILLRQMVGIQKHDHSWPLLAGQESHHPGHQCPLALLSNDREELYHATLLELCQSCLLKSKTLVGFSLFDMCLCCFHIFRHLSTNFHRYATGWSGTVQLAFVNSCNMLYWRSSYVDVQLVKAMLPGQASPSCVRAVVLADLRMSHIYLFMYVCTY